MDPHIFPDPDPGSQNLAGIRIRILSTALNICLIKDEIEIFLISSREFIIFICGFFIK